MAANSLPEILRVNLAQVVYAQGMGITDPSTFDFVTPGPGQFGRTTSCCTHSQPSMTKWNRLRRGNLPSFLSTPFWALVVTECRVRMRT
jgi:hypothetical protein